MHFVRLVHVVARLTARQEVLQSYSFIEDLKFQPSS